ncbi:coiled-coil domain-containing protein [Thiofaba sp. EF100]|uniref:coiled-coil domain-containing protein n=1 Tax=Thiofaba sp. EF100 TaxID=3121274 RepID=UPI003222028C
MATIAFDTHKFVRKLEAAGFTPQQAEAVAEALKDASMEAEVATKRDVERLEAKMDMRFEQINGKMTLMQWMLGLLLGGVVMLLLRSFFPV